jgi:hypothetical protein
MILTWQASEAGFGIIKTDFNGKKMWGSKHNASDIATDGKRLFVVGDFGSESMYQPKVFDAKDCRPLNWGNGKLALEAPAGGTDADNIATAIAYGNGKIYASWPRRNAISVYDATSGDLLESWNVPAPGDLAVRPDGSLAVISQGKVLTVSNGQSSVLISDHVDLAESNAELIQGVLQVHNGIAVAPDGTIYVANNGKLQDVSIFDAQGRYLRSIGTPGGRPARGRYDKNGVFEPGNIALDKNGRLWVAETTDYPKRISVWDAKTGANVNEFFGGSSYFGWAYMDPRHPDELYCHNVIWKIDWKNNTCTPYSTIWRPTAPDEVFNVNPGGYNATLRVRTLKDGSQIAFGYGGETGPWQYIVSRRDGDLFKPYSAMIEIRREGQYATGNQYSVFSNRKKYPDGSYYWSDANNDQAVQENEVTKDVAVWKKLWADLAELYASPEDIEGGAISFDNSGGWNLARFKRPASDRASKIVWAYQGGKDWKQEMGHAPLTAGDMTGLTMPLGVAGDFTGAASYFGIAQLVTKDDGVYVGQLFRDGRLGGGSGPDTLNSETIIGQLVKPDGMNRTFFLGGAADGRVTEVLGLDTVKRLPDGEYTFTAADAKKALDAQTEYRAKLAKLQRLAITRGRNSLDSGKPVGKSINPQRGFTARAACDAENLYIRYDVTSESELINEATDPHLIFKGGNLFDIQLATDLSADPKRKTPVPGDLRLLVTRQGGKPYAVLFQPKVKGFKGQPIVLKSPANQESFDAIELVQVGLEYSKTGTGFNAVVTIPLKMLNWSLKPGQQIQMDLGYIFGNTTGNGTSARAYWSNNGFAANVINDVPNESKLEPAEWGTATVE